MRVIAVGRPLRGDSVSRCRFAVRLVVGMLVVGVGVGDAAAHVNSPGNVKVGQRVRLRLTGARVRRIAICGTRRRASVAPVQARMVARITVADRRPLRGGIPHVQLVLEHCEAGRWRRLRPERLTWRSRYRRVRRYRRLVDTSMLGYYRLQVRAPGDRRRRAARSRFAYLRVTPAEIVELPIRFSVTNVNRSQVPCPSDGAKYQIVGSLVAPRGRLEQANHSVTLYLHGAAGDYWRFRAVAGYDFAAALGRLGHASVVIDRLGYNRSPQPNGLDVCTGSQADIAHQIVMALRTGGYTAGRAAGPRFSRVALAGHSAGALIANVESYSFGDIDALVSMAWADQGQSQHSGMEAAKTGLICAAGGQPKKPGRAGGYAYVGQNANDFRSLVFYNVDPAVFDRVVAVRERDPCGELGSVPSAIAADQTMLSSVHVPVLLVFDDHDGFFPPPAGRQQKGHFTGSNDVTYVELANTGHALFLERTAPALRARVADWLSKHRF